MNHRRFCLALCLIPAFLGAIGCTTNKVSTAPGVKWQFPADSQIVSTPALAPDGTVYFNSTKFLYAISPDGKLRWRYSPGGGELNNSPVVGDDGTIYIADNSCNLHALNPDGSRRWLADFSERTAAKFTGTNCWNPPTPTLSTAGILAVWKATGTASVVDPHTGGITGQFSGWRTSINSSASPEIASDGAIIVGGGALQSIDSDGRILWTVTVSQPGLTFRTPAVANGMIAVAGWDEKMHAYKSDGSLLWEFAGDFAADPVIASDGTIYVGGTGNTGLVALRPDGTKLWEAQIVSPGMPALGADGTLYVPGRYQTDVRPPWYWPSWFPWSGAPRNPWNFALYALHAHGTIQWRVDVDADILNGPTLGPDGTVYFGTNSTGQIGPKPNSGTLYAVHGSAGLMKGGWPKSYGSAANDGRVPSNP